MVRCASHQANLTVKTAISGATDTDAQKHPLTATIVRFYKFLLSDYHEEFARNLRHYVSSNCRVLQVGRQPASQATRQRGSELVSSQPAN